MISFKRLMKFMIAVSILAFLFALSAGCSASKEAVASPMKVTPVPPASPAPAVDYDRIEKATKRAETAASLSEAAAKKAEMAAQTADMAAGRAEKSADRAEAAANKAEAIFMKKMKK